MAAVKGPGSARPSHAAAVIAELNEPEFSSKSTTKLPYLKRRSLFGVYTNTKQQLATFIMNRTSNQHSDTAHDRCYNDMPNIVGLKESLEAEVSEE